jgi:hypothetical protein
MLTMRKRKTEEGIRKISDRLEITRKVEVHREKLEQLDQSYPLYSQNAKRQI